MSILTKDQRDARTAEEADYWFLQAEKSRQAIEHQAAIIRTLRHELEVAEREVADYRRLDRENAERFDLITQFVKTAQRTGYTTSWHVGGITAEGLRQETKNAEDFRKPLEFEQIGGILSQDWGDRKAGDVIMNKGGAMPMGVLYRPIFARPETKKKGAKKA